MCGDLQLRLSVDMAVAFDGYNLDVARQSEQWHSGCKRSRGLNAAVPANHRSFELRRPLMDERNDEERPAGAKQGLCDQALVEMVFVRIPLTYDQKIVVSRQTGEGATGLAAISLNEGEFGLNLRRSACNKPLAGLFDGLAILL